MSEEVVDIGVRFPAIHANVYHTESGTPYLIEPGVVLIAMPLVHLSGMQPFLDSFDTSLGFSDYLKDATPLDSATQLCKVAGQTCYMSFGPKHTTNADAKRYFDNMKSSGHGSVLEHANFSFLFYGISRSLTHELVRHRAGFGFSQVSQRYVSGKVLRFVERPEFVEDKDLHAAFVRNIDQCAQEYDARANTLLALQEDAELLRGDTKTDRRKKVQQAARSCLPNETEAPIVVTANVRAWRHFIEMRASDHSDIEIRRLAGRVYVCLRSACPTLFDDYEIDRLNDTTWAVTNTWRKV